MPVHRGGVRLRGERAQSCALVLVGQCQRIERRQGDQWLLVVSEGDDLVENAGEAGSGRHTVRLQGLDAALCGCLQQRSICRGEGDQHAHDINLATVAGAIGHGEVL